MRRRRTVKKEKMREGSRTNEEEEGNIQEKEEMWK